MARISSSSSISSSGSTGAREPGPSVRSRPARWVTALTATGAPLVLAGLSVLATNPDYQALGLILGVLVLIAALVAVLMWCRTWWLLMPAVVTGIAVLVIAGPTFQTQVMAHSGVRTEAVVTAVHSVKGKKGNLIWTCDIRRYDGRPLPHAELTGGDCWGPTQVGDRETVVVDPSGWLPPVSSDWDFSGAGVETTIAGVLTALFALCIAAAGRRGVREARKPA
ncbi:hypothetical protein [Kitasatospora sp. MAP5-34]|uniref:hypothetical protein n=1 Tax=Kitasatospora sp. MAP5-34 TaxID=3035102 RepID=UPI0024741879|nr:hypothetical protein [Kitasatospora sp. MAP5-34]MDH6575211.1 hypothetical protein [Kitasatospora sp. MAP5-34]